MAPTVQASVDADEVDKLVASGASALALSLLGQNKSPGREGVDAWMSRQRQRIAIYQQQANWAAVLAELEHLPGGLSADYLQWLRTQVAKAYLNRAEGAAARDILFALLWSDAVEPNSTLFRQWRMLIVQSYLSEGHFDDAYVAALRYEQDYVNSRNDVQWAVIKARVLIAAGRAEAVRALLMDNLLPQAVLVLHTSLLDSRFPISAPKLLQVIPLLADPHIDVDIKYAFSRAFFGAYKRIAELPQRVSVLEALLSMPLSKGIDMGGAGNALWEAYDALALNVSNKLQLLMGDYETWFVAAEEFGGDERARALYAWLAVNLDGEQASYAHQKLSELLIVPSSDYELLMALYFTSSRFGIDATPVDIRFRLLDQALTQGRLTEARRIMNSLPRPDVSQDLVNWQIRQARIQVLKGEPKYGAKLLEQLVKAGYSFNASQMDAYMQVFFDLKAMAEYSLAYMLADALLPQVPNIAAHRQLLAWMGDIRVSQQRYTDAARFYLRSATLVNTAVLDVHGKEVKRQAAQALALAGLTDDARNLYRSLIDGEKNTELKAILIMDRDNLRPLTWQ